MLFNTCLTILICLMLGISGCMKAAEPKPSPRPTERGSLPQVETKGPADSKLPGEDLSHPYRSPDNVDHSAPLTLLAVAGNFAARGEADKALHFLDQAADGFALGKNGSGEATAWSRKVILLSRFNREEEALVLIREAGVKWKAPPLTAFPAYLEGHLALLKGDFRRALSLLNRSLQENISFSEDFYLMMLRRDTELDAGIAGILSDRLPRLLAIYGANSAPATREEPAGETHLRNVLALNRSLRQAMFEGHPPVADFEKSEADAHNFLGLEAWMRGNRAEARDHLASAQEWSRKSEFPAAGIRGLLFLAELGLQGEDVAEGRQAAELLRERSDRYRNSRYRVWARFILSRYATKEGRNREAIGLLEEAAAVIEAERSALKAEMVDEVCRRQRRAVYESLVELLAGEGMVREALTAAEKAKALMTVDLLAGQDLGRTPAERERIREEAALGAEMRDLQQTLLQVTDEAAADSLRERLKRSEAAYRTLINRIGGEDERLLSLIAARSVNPTVLQRQLDENTTLFDYFTTGRGLYVWAIHRDRIHQERIDLPREELRLLVLSFRAAIRDRNKRKMENLSRKAYDLLLKPVIPFVSGERIAFIPDDALVYLPFAAMNYRGKFLAEGFSIFQLPSADLFGRDMGGTKARGMRILAFGDTDPESASESHHTSRELEQIRKRIAGTTVLLGRNASEVKAEEMPTGYDILHFAVRGQFFPEATLNSGLLLTPGAGRDGRLTIREIFGLRFEGRGVVLSGCDPVPEKDPEGKGLLALQRAFLNMGSPAVISTLWLGDDKAPVRFMELFYRQLDRKKSFADALRAAQLQLLREGQPPYVWAGFALTGGY